MILPEQATEIMIDGSKYKLKKCCGDPPMIVKEQNTGDWEGFMCQKCGRTVFMIHEASVFGWNSGFSD